MEVEARFRIPKGVEERIGSLGGELRRELTFVDCYYDTQNWALTLRDFWIRRRDSTWQLKYPPPLGRTGENWPIEQYAETEDEAEICQLVGEVLKAGCAEDHDVQYLMTRTGCGVFAEYTTIRKSYKFTKEENISVDLDVTNFGYEVGEIETM
uniref:CYTH domain-containing protein n=1 Tax=Capitella teleta TaxID=283909 RepID=X2B3E8_CAPTE